MRNSIGRRARHIINPPRHNAFTVDLDFSQIVLLPGDTHTVTATVNRFGAFSDSVTVTAANLPTGITVAPVTVSPTQTTGNVNFVASGGASPSSLTTVTLTTTAVHGGPTPVTNPLNCQIANPATVTSVEIEAITLDQNASLGSPTVVPLRLPIPPDVITIADVQAGKVRLFDETTKKEVPFFVEPLITDNGPVPHHRSKLDIGGNPTATGTALSPLVLCGGFNASLAPSVRKPYRLDIGISRSVTPPANITATPPMKWGENGIRFTTSSDGTRIQLQQSVTHVPYNTSNYLTVPIVLSTATASYTRNAGSSNNLLQLFYNRNTNTFFLDMLGVNTPLSHLELEYIAACSLGFTTTVSPQGTPITWHPGVDNLASLGITFTEAGATAFNDVSRSWSLTVNDNGRHLMTTFALPRADTPAAITASAVYLSKTQFLSDVNYVPVHSRSWPVPYNEPDICYDQCLQGSMGTYITARVGSFFAGSLAAYNPGYVYADRWLTTGQHFYWHAALMGPMGMDRSLTNAGAANDNAPVLSVNEFYINPWQFAVGYALTQYPRWKTVLRHMTANTWWANVSRSANTLTFGVTRRTDAFTLNGLTAHTWLGINTISGFFNGSPLASNILPPTELAHQKMLSILSGSTNPVTGYLPQANGNNLTTYTRVVDLQNQPTKPSPKSYMTELANDALWKAIIFAGPRWSQTFRDFFVTTSRAQMALTTEFLLNFAWTGSDVSGAVDSPRGLAEGMRYVTHDFLGFYNKTDSTFQSAVSASKSNYYWDTNILAFVSCAKELADYSGIDAAPTASQKTGLADLGGFRGGYVSYLIRTEPSPDKKKIYRGLLRHTWRTATGYSKTGNSATWLYDGTNKFLIKNIAGKQWGEMFYSMATLSPLIQDIITNGL
jgi:hypothetical protein